MGDLKVNEIKTDTIKNQSGTTVMTVDSTGRLLRPSSTLVAFDTTTVSGGNISSGTVPFNTAALNLGNHFNTSTYKFTAPVDGVYEFHARCLCGDAVNNDACSGSIDMMLDGSTKVTTGHFNTTDAWENIALFKIISMTANQTMEIQVSGTGNGGYIYANGSGVNDYNRFIGKLLG
tara:strand:+ start:7327 stop:7854 length:528 start_codon:yes stop_codon:yes gene_type:complete